MSHTHKTKQKNLILWAACCWVDELNSSSFIFLMYCNNSALAAFYSLINKGLVQLGVISNAQIIPERTNSKRIRRGSEALGYEYLNIPIYWCQPWMHSELPTCTSGIMFSLKQQSKGIINNFFACLKFQLFIHLLALMFISYGQTSVHMEVSSHYAMHHMHI